MRNKKVTRFLLKSLSLSTNTRATPETDCFSPLSKLRFSQKQTLVNVDFHFPRLQQPLGFLHDAGSRQLPVWAPQQGRKGTMGHRRPCRRAAQAHTYGACQVRKCPFPCSELAPDHCTSTSHPQSAHIYNVPVWSSLCLDDLMRNLDWIIGTECAYVKRLIVKWGFPACPLLFDRLCEILEEERLQMDTGY